MTGSVARVDDVTGPPPLYPVVLDMAGRSALVVGGGPVAARKVAALARSGAAVTVVAPAVCDAIEALAASGEAIGPGTVSLDRRTYRPGEAATFRLVVTATGVPAVDGAVAADAEAAGVWVNSADDAEHCTFLLPSVHLDGRVSIAVSTGGASPAMATWLRRRIGAAVGTDLGTLAVLLEEARLRLRAEGRATDSVDWQAVLDGELRDLVRNGEVDAARELLRNATR